MSCSWAYLSILICLVIFPHIEWCLFFGRLLLRTNCLLSCFSQCIYLLLISLTRIPVRCFFEEEKAYFSWHNSYGIRRLHNPVSAEYCWWQCERTITITAKQEEKEQPELKWSTLPWELHSEGHLHWAQVLPPDPLLRWND